MSAIPWNHFHFVGYVIGVSIAFFIVAMNSLILFCTMTGLLPIFVRSWRNKIRIYSIIIALLGGILFLFGILTITDKGTREEISRFMEIMWTNLNESTTKLEVQQFWNDVQMEYECCGLNSFYNYNSAANLTIPETCCASDVKPCTFDNTYRTYCYDAVTSYYENVVVVILATVAFTLSFVCLILTILAQFSKDICGLPDSVDENVSVL